MSLNPDDTKLTNLADLCHLIELDNGSYGLQEMRYYLIPVGLSCIALFLAGGFILLSRKLQTHPYRLLGWTCLFESITYNYYPSVFIKCGFVRHDSINIVNVNALFPYDSKHILENITNGIFIHT